MKAAAVGAGWSIVATLVHLAMFRRLLPAPSEGSLPVAVALYAVRAPFVAAIYLSGSITRRTSPDLGELVVEAVVIGILAALAIAALARRWRRRA